MIIFDNDVPGFGIRIRASGSRNFIFQYKYGTRHRRLTLGPVTAYGIVKAREIAKDLYAAVRLGRDPASEKIEARIRRTRDRIVDKFASFIERGTAPACYLYRHYHPSGDLLYVGISLSALKRQIDHIREADWRTFIYQIVIEPFETREEALEAEQVAIRTEFPKFNTMHNGRRHPVREIAGLGSSIDRVPPAKPAETQPEATRTAIPAPAYASPPGILPSAAATVMVS